MPRLSPFSRSAPRVWVIATLCALVVVGWTDLGRVRRIEAVSALQGRARKVDQRDPLSPTGYADRQREQIVPEAGGESAAWIALTQRMLATGQARIRHLDYENTPNGHAVSAPSPYRWWLGFLAWAHHRATGIPIGISVERAALYSDPILHALLLCAAALLVASRFGGAAATVVAAGVGAFYPFSAGFVAGLPGGQGLGEAFALLAVLLVLLGVDRLGQEPRGGFLGWFAAAGVMGGLGMWISVRTQAVVTSGILLGALLSSWAGRREGGAPPEPAPEARAWRTWGYCGGVTVLAAYLAEYFPGDMGALDLGSVHPAYGIAWVGAGEFLALATPWIRGPRLPWTARRLVAVTLSIASIAALPVLILWTGSWRFPVQDPSWARLCRLPGSPAAASLGAWLLYDGVTPAVGAAFLPLLAAVPAAWVIFSRQAAPRARAVVAVAAGPVLAGFVFACRELSAWGMLDAALLCLLAAACAEETGPGRRTALGLGLMVALGAAALGLPQLVPRGLSSGELSLSSRESEALVDRHLAHWLSKRSGGDGVVVYASPDVTPGLCYYGSLRGIGSPSADNAVGFGAALNIAAALSMEDARNQLQARGVRFVVVPSWDTFFDEFAQRYLDKRFANRPNFFVGELRRLSLPPWLRPIPYQMPVGGGFDGHEVLVFEVVDDQAPAVAASRVAEYLVEMGDLDKAGPIGEALRKFPGDLGALAALVEIQLAQGETAPAGKTLEALLSRLSGGADRYLPWDRRVSLAIVLAQAGRVELARDQAGRCLRDATEERLRSLTTGSLFNLLVIGRALGLQIADPGLRDTAAELLPEDLRGRL
jgi:hypothetical protein